MTARKRAVLVIHGIGNQQPMATLRSIVDTLWTSDTSLKAHDEDQDIWLKPDRMDNGFELRRFTTTRDVTGVRTDFYEFYWAHLMEDTQFASVISWLKRIFVRWPTRVPSTVWQAWALGLVAILGLLGGIGYLIYRLLLALHTVSASLREAGISVAIAVGIWLALWFLRHRVLIQVVGDAACYLTPDPQNIAARARIRAAGLKILEHLNDSSDYERVTLVTHSLGTVVGYDILNFFWADRSKDFDNGNDGVHDALGTIETCAAKLRDASCTLGIDEYQDCQRAYCGSLAKGAVGKAWKITDFVTLGSPLTHADFLLVDDEQRFTPLERARVSKSQIAGWLKLQLSVRRNAIAQVFASRVAERTFPASPPETDSADTQSFSYVGSAPATHVIPHHAALFSAVRWTNIYAVPRLVLWGDIVGGPVAPLFGPGVRDIDLTGPMHGQFMAHVHYWDLETPHGDQHIRALRNAVNLLDRPAQQVWAGFQ